MTKISVFKELLKRPVAYNAGLARMMKSPTAAIMLSQGIYWQDKADDDEQKTDGWFYVTAEQWYEQTGLTTENQSTARKLMCARGFWMEQRCGLPAKLFFKINVDELELQFLEFTAEEQRIKKEKASFRESQKQETGGNGNRFPYGTETCQSEPRKQLESKLKSIKENILKDKEENAQSDFQNPSSTLKAEKKEKKDAPAPRAAKPKKERTGRVDHDFTETFEVLKGKNTNAHIFFLNNPDIWDGVIRYRIEIKKQYASAESEAIAMVKFWKDAKGSRENAEAMIEKTVSAGYQGFFPVEPPKQNGYNQPAKQGTNPYDYSENPKPKPISRIPTYGS